MVRRLLRGVIFFLLSLFVGQLGVGLPVRLVRVSSVNNQLQGGRTYSVRPVTVRGVDQGVGSKGVWTVDPGTDTGSGLGLGVLDRDLCSPLSLSWSEVPSGRESGSGSIDPGVGTERDE